VDASTVEFHDYVNPVLLRQEVGRRLRGAREEVDLTVIDVGAHLDVAASTVSRIETGRTQVSMAVVQAMMRLYKLDDDELLDLVRRARQPGWWKQYGFSDEHFIALESGASRISTFQPDLVHGLLQTADYARVLFSAGMQTRSRRWIDNQLDARMIRQERLADEAYPLALDAVVSEFALCRPVGGRDVMRAQLRHLALITELPTVTVRVLPTTVVSTPAMYGAFSILDFPTIQPSMVYVEHAIGTERTEKDERVGKTRLRLSHLRSLALDREESVALIERVAEMLWAE
jgi:transcriptional regulator with XRE-family HTH domain